MLVAACGGGSGNAGEPLLAGNIEASYDGEDFTPAFGFATGFQDGNIVALGDGPIHCGTESQNAPPPGRTIIVSLDALAEGTFTGVFVQMFRNVDDFEGIGSDDGSVTIDLVDDTIAGTLSYAFTDTDNRTFSASGSFEVHLCL
jgi:hypothetical protein